MLSCIAEDEVYLSRICFSDEAIYRVRSQQTHLLCMGVKAFMMLLNGERMMSCDEEKTLSVPSFLKTLQ
jgi:hypothetical protein